MRVTLLGTGDTTGTPTPGCSCDTCEAAVDRDIERTRFSVHIENERTGESFLIDMSPDARYQLLRDSVLLPDEVIITHIHFDHLDGLGNAYRLLDSLPVHAAAAVDPQTGESVAETIAQKYDYLDQLDVHPQQPFEPFEICGVTATLVPVEHPPLACYGLAIEDETGAKLSITGDTNFAVPDASRDVLSDADLLLADAIVPARLCKHHPLGGTHENEAGVPRTFGTKHMTTEGALSLAAELNAAQTRLVHVSHFPTPEEAFGEHTAVDGEQYIL
ncbi:MBL fold metallo-hydrolase [Halocatena marina]|uniref:MBL fold metallo-hydrolase n=1 Tax=Halocatena marina TaxID=2934937 RepID=A0ABD5YLT9_9EURY|nr:MBL fold metallo-hydrolase [Halocatena marina]